jgi:hypothetical protein
MMTYLKNYSPMQVFFVNGKMEEIQFEKNSIDKSSYHRFSQNKGTLMYPLMD